MKYEPKEIEKKWQDRWEAAGAFEASDGFSKPKFYGLTGPPEMALERAIKVPQTVSQE